MSAPAAAPEETAPPAKSPPAPPAPRPGGRPAWQRHRLFKFFASVKLAVVLLSVLIVASIVGTLYETSFDAKVARAYIYNAWWFDLWLTVLCVNLACAAFSRMPWKRHHTGFLITHLGIIILLVGAMIGRGWGIEGTMTLHKGEPPRSELLVDQRVLRVEQPGFETRQYPVEIIGRHPTPARPWPLDKSAGGWDITLVDYAPQIDAAFEPQPAPPAMTALAQPAVRVRLVTRRVGATLDHWLLAGDAEHGSLDLSGLASVKLQRGTAPLPATTDPSAASTAPDAPAVNEAFVALALSPAQTVDIPGPNSLPSGANVRLTVDAAGKKTVLVDWRGATWSFDPDADRGQPQPLSDSGLSVVIEGYWPDFVMRDGKPATASPDPRNPAVLVRVTGTLPTPAADDPAAPPPTAATSPGIPPPMGAGTQASNQAVIYCDEQGRLTYTLKSRAAPAPVRGTLRPGEAVGTGWMDWQLEAVQAIPAALSRTTFRPVRDARPTNHDQSATSGDPNVVNGGGGANNPGPMTAGSRGEGVLVRLTRDGQTLEQWAAVGWQVTLPTTPQPTRLAYDSLIQGLPIGLQLENFEVTFNDGTEDPASFQSHLRVTDAEGREGTGSCSMNQPFNFPGHWWNTFSGLTFKMSQAQWSPNDLNQSTVQILRDPGWLFKWIGSLLVSAGVFTLFYLRPAKVPVKPKAAR